MSIVAYLRSLASRFLHRDQLEQDLQEEIESHIQLRADDLARAGLDRRSAERQARLEFGGRLRYKEEAREEVAGHVLETLVRDVRVSLRQLRKAPSFAVAAIVTLAIAIGANAVVFSAVNGFVLRPLGLPDEGSLYDLERAVDLESNESYPNYLDLRQRNRSFQDLAADNYGVTWLDFGTEPVRAWGFEVTGNYFDVLGIRPHVGRFFHASDEHGPNSAPYLVLSYAYWHSHLQDDPGIIGRTARINRHPFTIIGVAPPGFHGTVPFASADFFVPMVNQQQVDGSDLLNARGNRWLSVFGHLRPGVTPAQATADLNAIGAALEQSYPREDQKMSMVLTQSHVGGDAFGRALRAFLAALMLLSALILLAACANLGSLFAARATERSREVALQLALGAGRGRILRQLFTEAVLVALAGGAVGLWGSILLLEWLRSWRPIPQFALHLPIAVDARVYGFALLLSLASGFLFGAIPVRQVLRTDPYQVVKAGPAGAFGRRFTMRDLLVAVQIAICAVLVTSSLVAVRGLVRSLHSSLGVEPRDALLVENDLAAAGYGADRIPPMQDRMIDAVRTIPGVAAVGLVAEFPPLHVGWDDGDVFSDNTTDLRPSNAATHAIRYRVSPDYFRAAGTMLLAGRTFTAHDDTTSLRVAVVNQTFARKLFGSPAGAIGRFFKLPDGTRELIVGLVEDGKYTANLAESPQPAVFLSLRQSPASETWMIVRSTADPRQLSTAVRARLRQLDPGLPFLIESWSSDMNGALLAPRLAAVTLGILGLMGAIVAIAGIFGTAAYSLSKRLKELGIRVALGAQRWQVLEAALGRAFRLLAFGSAAGLILGIVASQVLASIVYQATPRDPIVLAGVVVAMFVLGLVATWIPARRALALDPLILLRSE